MTKFEHSSAPESVDTVAGMFSSCTNAVPNVCATGIKPAATSVFLRAHWPWDLHPASTGVEVYAAPQLSTNAWVGVGTAPISGGDNGTVIELPYSVLPDGWTSSMFFMLGLNVDTDQDGLSDSFERIVSKTDPDLADTDGDGMPDGWEYNNGLDPRSAVADDAGGAPTRIVNQWCANRTASGDVNAWMDANAANHAWNACAIVKGRKYVYFRQDWLGLVKTKTVVEKGDW